MSSPCSSLTRLKVGRSPLTFHSLWTWPTTTRRTTNYAVTRTLASSPRHRYRQMDHQSRIRAVISCVPDFQHTSEHELHVEALRGGLTNLLWMVGKKTSFPNKTNANSPEGSTDDEYDGSHERKKSKTETGEATIALVREYGRGTESFMNRVQEERVVQHLSKEDLCPQVFGVYSWGRVEKYLQGSRTLSTVEYASEEYISRVASLLGKFHAQSSSLLPLCTVPGSESQLKDRLYQWYNIASAVKFNGDDQDEDLRRKQRKLAALDFPGTVKSEIQWLLKEIDRVKSPIVFCHCDLQDGNVLLHNDELHMIDFEYSDRLERGFDLGNCFCEMALDYRVSNFPGFVVNPDMFPDERKQIQFLQAYAEGAGIDFTNENKQQLIQEANLFAMCSHLHWAIWSVVQARNSTIEFGYMEYAEQRMDQYFNFKKKVWPKLRS